MSIDRFLLAEVEFEFSCVNDKAAFLFPIFSNFPFRDREDDWQTGYD